MKYATGSVGRCIVVRFEDGDDVLEGIRGLAKKEQIRSAVFYLVGGLKGGRLVVGPETEEMPPRPVWRGLTESHEVFGIGTVFWQGEEPKIHLHGAFGKQDSVKAGCLRESTETFLILEAVILELQGIDATRELDPVSGMVLLKL
jgi:predicted DNA-binding protein with PD1-like motif